MGILSWVILITATAGIGGTGLGGMVGALLRRDSDKAVSLLLSFAGGVMLAVVCFDLITGALFPHGPQEKADVLVVIGGILVGYGGVGLLNGGLDRRAAARTNSTPMLLSGLVTAGAIALHNLPEGMVIGAGYAAGDAVSPMGSGGFLLAVVIGLHNIPEGMAVAAQLIVGGMKKGRAVILTALTGLPTVIGALLGYRLGTLGTTSLSLVLSLASGAMLYVVLGELLPEGTMLFRSKLPAFAALLGLLVGLLIVYC